MTLMHLDTRLILHVCELCKQISADNHFKNVFFVLSCYSLTDGATRFPKLEECAHFHYDFVELGQLQVSLSYYHHYKLRLP